jgi:hypothetical protein
MNEATRSAVVASLALIAAASAGWAGGEITRTDPVPLQGEAPVPIPEPQIVAIVRAEDFDGDADEESYTAVFERQNARLTEDETPASASFYPPMDEDKTLYTGDVKNHIDLAHGWVYTRVQNPERRRVAADEAEDDLESMDDTPKRYPVTTVRALGAGAEGTDLLVAVTRKFADNGNQTPHAVVYVMHMGGAKGSRVWLSAPDGAETEEKYQSMELRFGQRARKCLKIQVTNYFDPNTPNSYEEIKRPRFHKDAIAAAIYDDVVRRRDADPVGFFQAERSAN